MSSLFSRRKRTTSTPHTGPPRSTAATTAAAQAFLAQRASNAALSEAAAAAALRSLTSSPVPPGDLDTRRRQRRGSQNSIMSAPGGFSLRRQSSSGSMSERTFRDQSPAGRGFAQGEQPPPMPALPNQYAGQGRSRLPPRPMSTEPYARLYSPVQRNPTGRGMSLDRGPKPPPSKLKKVARVPEEPRGSWESGGDPEGRRSSVNFSRPMSPQNSSPPLASQPNGDAPKLTSANLAANKAVLSAAEKHDIEHKVNEAASAPVKKNKNIVSTEGSYLATARGPGKPTGTAVRNSVPDNEQNGNRQPTPKTPQKQYPASDSEQSDQDQVRASLPQERHVLSKKPSIVREDPEEEAQEDKSTPAVAPKTPTTEGKRSESRETPRSNTSSKVTPKAAPKLKAANEDLATKRASPSPARQAHFSERPMLDTPGSLKHQPPARSVSPAKSAMKQSPSPRGTSPAGSASGWNKPGHTPSEFSDTVSMGSVDGLTPGKRKSVRVSFDDEPTIVGQAAQSNSSSSPILSSPQDRQTKKNWFGLGKNKNKKQTQVAYEEEDDDDVMKPVPTLPSFGSVRSPKKPNTTTTETDEGHTLTSSSDHAVGEVLARETQLKTPSPEPSSTASTPADENRARRSDSDTSVQALPTEEKTTKSNGTVHASTPISTSEGIQTPTKAPADVGKTHEDSKETSAIVPQIAVLPATPGQDSIDKGNRDSWLGSVPGGFPKEDEAESESSSEPKTGAPLAETNPSTVGIAEPEPEEVAVQKDPELPDIGHIADSIRHQTTVIPEEDEDADNSGDSIYDDAAEEPSDFEGDGFGSINAIVESPVMDGKKKTKQSLEDGPPSPSPKQISPVILPAPVSSEPTEDWNKAQNYWSGLSTSRKAELERAAEESRAKEVSDTKPPAKSTASEGRNGSAGQTAAQKPIKSALKKSSEPPAPVEPVTKTAQTKPSLKKSMRDNPASASAPDLTQQPVQMRTSMRDGSSRSGSGRMGTTMRDRTPRQSPSRATSVRYNPVEDPSSVPAPQGRAALQKKQRPMSAAVAQTSVQGPKDKSTRPVSMASTPSAAAVARAKAANVPAPPALRRTTSNGSDSDSSFKRARQNRNQPNEGRISMRQSMRAKSGAARPNSMATTTLTQQNASSLSVRSLSPTGNSRLRSSMRQRPEPERPQSPVRSLFSRKKSTDATPHAPPPKAGPFKSRFGDSSDEEDNGPRFFPSRFVDSSDDEDGDMDLTPVRGIPKRQSDRPSTDLEDSEDERTKTTNKNAKPIPTPLEINANGEGNALSSGTLRRSGSGRGTMSPTAVEKKKKSFFGRLGRRKDKSSKVGKVDFESAARRDTKLERSKAEREALTDDIPQTPTDIVTPQETPAGSPQHARLVRPGRERIASDSWPLPPPIPESPASAIARPNTSDGTGKRPKLQRNISTVSATTGKKKRFPKLRKAFGLRD